MELERADLLREIGVVVLFALVLVCVVGASNGVLLIARRGSLRLIGFASLWSLTRHRL